MTETQLLPLLDASLRGALVAVALLLGTALWRSGSSHPVARVGMVFVAGLSVQAISSAPGFESHVPCEWQAPLIGISIGNSALFWLFSRALFDDDFRPRPWHAALWLAVVALGVAMCLIHSRPDPNPVLSGTVRMAMRWTPLVFAVLAAVAAASQWRSDLVERRRRLRLFILATGTVYTVAMVAARLAAPQGRLSGLTASFDIAALLLILAVVAAKVVNLTGSDLLPGTDASTARLASTPPPTDSLTIRPPVDGQPAGNAPALGRVPPAPDPTEDRLALSLDEWMTKRRAYQQEDLTVAGLATLLGAPEYRLRRLINQRLGHRNFNAYVNGFRLAEAKQALADPAQRALPVLSIALEAGFGSIGPFNRAFKDATGLTPTEYRRQNLADS